MVYLILAVLTLIYIIVTLKFAIKFGKMDTCFSDKQKFAHEILIWMIPFFWIIVVSTLMKPTPGSHEFKKKDEDDGFYESNLGG